MGEKSEKKEKYEYSCKIIDNRRELPEEVTIESDSKLSDKEVKKKAEKEAIKHTYIFPSEPKVIAKIKERKE